MVKNLSYLLSFRFESRFVSMGSEFFPGTIPNMHVDRNTHYRPEVCPELQTWLADCPCILRQGCLDKLDGIFGFRPRQG